MERIFSRLVVPVVGHRVVQYMDDLDWARIVDVLGYPSAGLGIPIESAGVPFPGEALVLAAAASAAARPPSLAPAIPFRFLGAPARAAFSHPPRPPGGAHFV